MTTKEKLAAMLEEAGDTYISGNAIAESLGISRTAIWKNIRQLEEEGYAIEAVTNRGYRLAADNDAVSLGTVRKYLGDRADDFDLQVFSEVTSTNDLLKAQAATAPEWTTFIAGRQSAGKGRSGRSFYSPSDTGLYLSMLQHPVIPAEQATRITTAAAVAACRAIEECTDSRSEIKWVNDVFVNGKKVCGILTEASFNMESGLLDWAVMGIGFNIYEPEEGFPEDIRDIAGPVTGERRRNLRSALAASFMVHFRDICSNLQNADFAQEYRSRSFLIGQRINVLKREGPVPAVALDVDDECRLIVRYDDGMQEALSSGEVSVRPVK